MNEQQHLEQELIPQWSLYMALDTGKIKDIGNITQI